MKYLLLLSIVVSWFFWIVFPVEAATCRTLNNHHVCIVRIKRSAKNYWEYRTIISVDGRERPREIYNCRDKYTIEYDRAVIPFKKDSPGELICGLFNK